MSANVAVQVLLNGLMIGGMYALVASGFTLILGVMKIFNFAQGQFYMLGALITYAICVILGLPYIIAIILSLIAMAALGILLYLGIIKWTTTSFFRTILVTLTFSTIVRQSTFLSFGLREKSMPSVIPGILHIGGVTLSNGKLFIILIAVAAMVGVYYFMKLKVGLGIRAVAESRDVASLQGINPTQIFLATMGLGCGLCGIAGGLIVPINGISSKAGDAIFVMVFLTVLVGGMGSMPGALLAAFVLGVIESFAYQFVAQYNLIIIFTFLAILFYFRPGGLLGKPLPIPTQE